MLSVAAIYIEIFLSYGYTLTAPLLPCAASSVKATTDSQSFLFTLVNPSGTEPVKITPKPDAPGGIRCQNHWGPTFGTSQSYDLLVWYKESSGIVNYLDLGHGFTCPKNADKRTYFTGKSPFEIDQMEVYRVDV